MHHKNVFSFANTNESQNVFVTFQKQNEPEHVFFTLQKQNEPWNVFLLFQNQNVPMTFLTMFRFLKIQNILIFSFFICRYFPPVQTCFDVDVARCKWVIDMVDGVLGTMDRSLSKRDMVGFAPLIFRANGGCF